jgi:formiminotetrahydrofolate cyclodeaminase
MTNVDPLLGLPTGQLLNEIASEKPAPGAGSVTALVVAMAAGLAAMAARLSLDVWDGAPEAVEAGEAIRARVLPLAPADGHAYEEVMTALRLPDTLEPVVREAAVSNALARAAEIPLAIAGEARATAELASRVAERGNANLRSDAAAGAVFAAAAARVTAHLVAVNLQDSPDDRRIALAKQHADDAALAAERALSSAL